MGFLRATGTWGVLVVLASDPHLHPCPGCCGTWKGRGGGARGQRACRGDRRHLQQLQACALPRAWEANRTSPKLELTPAAASLQSPGCWALSPGFRATLAMWQLRREKVLLGDIPGGPVVKNLPSYAGEAGSILAWGFRTPHASGAFKPTPGNY